MSDREVSARHPSQPPAVVPTPDAAVPAPPAAASPGSVSGRSEMLALLQLPGRIRQRSAVARLFGFSPLTAAGSEAYRHAMGAIEVGDALDAFVAETHGWHVLHSVAVDEDADLDHLLVGPSGVYIVATAVHPDGIVEASQRTFTVSDVRHPHIRNMEYEMGRVERLLSAASATPVEVSGVLAVVDPKSLVVREPHRDVAVLPASSIVRWMSGRPRILPPAVVDVVAAAMKRSSTWEIASPPADDTENLRAGFDRLRRDVERAWNRQRLWATAITVAAAGAFIVVTYSILVAAIGAGRA